MIESNLRVVVLSSPGFSTRRRLVLEALSKQGVTVSVLVVSSHAEAIKRNLSILWKRTRKFGFSFILDSFFPSIFHFLKSNHKQSTQNICVSKFYKKMVRVPSFQSQAALYILKELSPDLFVLAGVPILTKTILSIPKIGTLNGHLGWVPDFRGNYAVHWALQKSGSVGVTVHWVDEGIDTGPILARQFIKEPENGPSLEEWVQVAEEEGAHLLGLVVRDIVTSRIGPSDGIKQDLSRGYTYSYMHPKMQQQLRNRLKKRNLENVEREKGNSRKVLITTQVFPPETHPSAVMVRELANDISANGYQVTVAGGYPHHPYGQLYPGYKKSLLKTENCNGFRVVRGWHLTIPSSNLILRALVMTSQSMAYLLDSLVSPRPDVIISYGPPLMGPLISAMIARWSKAKLLTLIYDIYPDILVDMGYLRNPVLIKAANKLEGFIYSRSDKIGVLSEGFRNTLIENKGVEAGKIAIIPVWLDVRDIRPMDRNNLWRQEMHVPADKFVVLYAGTIGLVSGAEIVVETARILKSYPDILFLMVGEGFAKDKIEAQVKRTALTNIKFIPFQPRERLSEVQATADVSLVTLAPGRGKTSVPSKVLGYMAAARPVIASVDADCDTAELIRAASCGLVTPPDDARLLAQAILSLFNNPVLQKEMGERGQEYFEDYLERRAVMTKYIALVKEMVAEI